MADVRDTFPVVYSGGRRNKAHSKGYKDFNEAWGMQKVLFQLAGEEITKIAEVNQIYLSDAFTFLTYLIQKADADEEEDSFQDALRKAKKGR